MQRHSRKVPRDWRRRLAALARLAWKKLQSFQDPNYQGAPLFLPDHWHGHGDARGVSAEAVAEAFRTWQSMMANQQGVRQAMILPLRSRALSKEK